MSKIQTLLKTLAIATILAAATLRASAAGELLRNVQQIYGEVTVDPAEATVGEVVHATVSLTNFGSVGIDLCVGRGHFYRFAGTRSDDDGLMSSGVASCESHILLDPLQVTTVSVALEVPDVGNGDASLSLIVQLVDPTTCETNGCSTVMLPTSAGHLSIRGGKKPARRSTRTTANV